MVSANSVTTRTLRGLALPARRVSGGYFASKLALDLAWGDLLVALLVPRGSRAMRRARGSGLDSLLFSPLDADTNAAAASITAVAVQGLPHIRVFSVTATPGDKTLSISVAFGLVTDASVRDQRTFTVAQNTVGPALEF